MSVELPHKIMRFVVPEPNTGCWLWLGGCTGNGYPAMKWNKRQAPVHRVALILHSGPPATPDLFALHNCNTPLCVNPQHMRWGTQKENVADIAKAGRRNDPLGPREDKRGFKRGDEHWARQMPDLAARSFDRWRAEHPEEIKRGSKHCMAKLTEADIPQIRALAAEGRPYAQLAARFAVTPSNIYMIVSRRTWRHVA